MNDTIITCSVVPESQRVAVSAMLFGAKFPFVIEPAIYDFAGMLSEDYQGGSWEFFALSNGGFFMSPRSSSRFRVESPNGNTANMSTEAFGIVACLFAYSNLCFSTDEALTEMCDAAFHKLRDFALEHAEAADILRITD
jgi:hypothetical protein